MTTTPDATRERAPPMPDTDLRSDVRLANYKIEQLDKKFDRLTDELKLSYATKSELGELREDVKTLRENIGWAIKIVLAAVFVALVSVVVVKGGVPHP